MSTTSQPEPVPRFPGPIGIVVALPGELGVLREQLQDRDGLGGLELRSGSLSGVPVLAAVAGVGKVRAARAAALLVAAGARGLLSVGVCGGLTRRDEIGSFVHAERALQADFAVREGREVPANGAWLEAWESVVPGRRGLFLTADRPVLRLHARVLASRQFGSGAVAEMETAAIARVAADADLPWAGLRAVSDSLGLGRKLRFEHNYRDQAGRAAATVGAFLERLAR